MAEALHAKRVVVVTAVLLLGTLVTLRGAVALPSEDSAFLAQLDNYTSSLNATACADGGGLQWDNATVTHVKDLLRLGMLYSSTGTLNVLVPMCQAMPAMYHMAQEYADTYGVNLSIHTPLQLPSTAMECMAYYYDMYDLGNDVPANSTYSFDARILTGTESPLVTAESLVANQRPVAAYASGDNTSAYALEDKEVLPSQYWPPSVYATNVMMLYNYKMMTRQNLSVPTTWNDMLDLCERVNNTDMDGDGTPDAALCLDLAPGCKTWGLLLSIYSSMALTQGTQQGIWFNRSTFQPLFPNPAMAEALRLLRELSKYGSTSTCDLANLDFRAGKCLMTLDFASSTMWASDPHFHIAIKGYIGFARAPGSAWVWADQDADVSYDPSKARSGLRACSTGRPLNGSTGATTMCPQALQVPTSQGTELVNFAIFRTAITLTSSPVSPSLSAEKIGTATIFLSRVMADYELLWSSALSFLFDQTVTPDMYDYVGYNYSDVVRINQAFYEIFALYPNSAFDISIPFNQLYRLVIDNMAQQAILGSDKDIEGIMQSGLLNFSFIQSVVPLNHTFLLYYNATLGVNTSTSTPGGNKQTDTSSVSVILPAVLVPTATLLAVALVIWLMLWARRSRRTFLGKSKPPGSGSATTLVVTDIQSSTVLWEALPADVMDSAIRQHHRCLRALLTTHQGYESATEGDSFILAFHTSSEALAFSCEVQEALMELEWPMELLSHPEAREVMVEHSSAGGLHEVRKKPSLAFPLETAASATSLSTLPLSPSGLFGGLLPHKSRSFQRTAASLVNEGPSTVADPALPGARDASGTLAPPEDSPTSVTGRSDHGPNGSSCKDLAALMQAPNSNFKQALAGILNHLVQHSNNGLVDSTCDSQAADDCARSLEAALGWSWYQLLAAFYQEATSSPQLAKRRAISGSPRRATSSALNIFQPQADAQRGGTRLTLIHRGLRVRIGLHSGVNSEEVVIDKATQRKSFTGAALVVAKAVGDAAQGGMVMMSAVTLARLELDTPKPGKSSKAPPVTNVVIYAGRHDLGLRATVATDGSVRRSECGPSRGITATSVSIERAAAQSEQPAPSHVHHLTQWCKNQLRVQENSGAAHGAAASPGASLDLPRSHQPRVAQASHQTSVAARMGSFTATGTASPLQRQASTLATMMRLGSHASASHAPRSADSAKPLAGLHQLRANLRCEELHKAGAGTAASPQEAGLKPKNLPGIDLYMAMPLTLQARLGHLGPVRSKQLILQGTLAAPAPAAAIVFMHVYGATMLLADLPLPARAALTTFQTCVLQLLGDGYAVETADGFVLAAFSHPAQAIAWALQCVDELNKQAWPEAVLEHELGSEVVHFAPHMPSHASRHSSIFGGAQPTSSQHHELAGCIQLPMPPIQDSDQQDGPVAATEHAAHSTLGSDTDMTAKVADALCGSSSNPDYVHARHTPPTAGGHVTGGGARSSMAMRMMPLTSVAVSRGLRLRVGIDVGSINPELHPTTGRMVYRGRVMNRSARIAAKAAPGQVLASATAWDLSSTHDAIVDAGIYAQELGMFELKGVSEPIDLVHCMRTHAHLGPMMMMR